MALKDRILAYLQTCPDGADDGEIERALSVRYHSQVNSRCRELEAEGLIERRKTGRTLRNFYCASLSPAPAAAGPEVRAAAAESRPWYWEGNVQAAVVSYLAANGHRIVRVADTASREAGKDIVAAMPSGDELWVNVKGYPEATERTNPPTQARHWFAGALYDLLAWRGDNPSVGLALALPDFPTYRNMVQRIGWALPLIRASVLWVHEGGSVEPQEGRL